MEFVTEQARAAAANPRIAGVLKELDAVDVAVTTNDVAAFESRLGEDLVVNNPLNAISRRLDTLGFMKANAISYSEFNRKIEYLGTLGPFVVVMGEEVARPQGANVNAGKTIRRRVTDLWGEERGSWRLQLRQATIVSVE